MAGREAQGGEKTTNFALACTLLSQLVKENGFASRPVDHAVNGSLEHFRVPVTMNLLPGVDENNKEVEGESNRNTLDLFPQHPVAVHEDKLRKSEIREEEKSQLTIFYGGKVLVFDKFSAEKAEDLIQFASKTASSAQSFAYVPPTMASKSQHHLSAQSRFPDLPLTRKASLQRFFDSRKDRMKSKAPYSVVGSPRKATPAISEESATWLGFVPQTSKYSNLSLSSDSSK